MIRTVTSELPLLRMAFAIFSRLALSACFRNFAAASGRDDQLGAAHLLTSSRKDIQR
jgi:hypothetical protein